MKTFTLIFLSLFIYSVGKSQGPVNDTHPLSQIFIINYQSGQEVQASNDDAILFKDAFIDLVRNTDISKQILSSTPGRKIALVKQIDPQKLNGYQLTWQSVANQNRAVCTFYYNIDQNALYFYDQSQRNWTPVNIDGNNMNNLNNCQAYCKFNSNSSDMPDLSVSNAPVSDDVATQQDVSANTAPPALPEYEQPPCPVDGYLWQPGYWAYSRNANDYYWVPGVWIAPPNPGLYWTPCYWGYAGNVYVFHRGYWGQSVGFYGGINYGFGYVGVGYVGGVWHGRDFSYNTAVVRVNTTVIHNTYVNNTVINNTTVVNRTSFNGRGGVTATPTPQEQVAARQPHVNPTAAQVSHQQSATANKSQFASVNNGRPAVTTVARVSPAPVNLRNNNDNNHSAPNSNRNPGTPAVNNPNPNGGGNRANGNPVSLTPNTNGAGNNNNPSAPNNNRNSGTPPAVNNPNPNAGGNRANGIQTPANPNTTGNDIPASNNGNRAPGNQTDKAVNTNGNSTPPAANDNKTPGNPATANPNNKGVNTSTPDAGGQHQQQRQFQQRQQQQPKQQKPPKQRKQKNQ